MAFRVTRASVTTDPGLEDIASLEASAGDIIVASGVDDYSLQSTTTAGRTVLALASPGADRIAFWDDSGTAFGWLTLGSGLSITGTTLDIGVGSGDLGALEALSGTGIAARIGTDTWAQRTITGTAEELTVTNGDGVSGNPTISLPSAITLATKTLTGGTFSNFAVTGTITGDAAVDGVWTFNRVGIEGATPSLRFYETDAPADRGRWRFVPSGGGFSFRAYSDDELTNTTIMSVQRAGTTITEIAFNATALDVNATMDVSGALTNAGVTVPTISSSDTLSNKTLSSPTISGTVAGTPAIASAWAFSTSPTVPTPTNSTDAANKAYVDSVAVGLSVKTAVACATTANITLSGEQTIDGISTSASRVLVKDQSTASQNGIYVSAAGAWSRATDLDAWSEAIGALVSVTAGTVNANRIYVSTAAAGGTIGSTSLTFTLFISTSGLQPLDSDLTAIAALTTTSYGRSLLEAANAAALRTLAGTVIGTDVQAYSAVLAATTASFLTADETKLDGIEALADVTDATNVAAAGALMTSSLAANVATFLGTPSSTNLRAVLTDETGTGSAVFATSPTLVTPALGTPSALTLTNATGLPISTGVSGLGSNVATFLATPSSANLLAAVTNETGTGSLVFATSPTLVTPALGTPSSVTLTNATGLPVSTGISGLGTGVATFLATPSSANLAATVTDETGTGALVFANSPTLVTPALGTPASGVLTNATGLPISTGVSGLGSGVATFLATPSSANLAAAVTGETGTGALVFGTNPTIDAASGVIILPGATAPAQTAEGSVVWDTNDEKLTVGTGSVRKTMVDTDSAQTISNKSVTATGGSVARTIEAEWADEINVLDHCATVDGATDNTTGITAALALGMSSGKRVRFPAQTAAYITNPQNCTSAVQIVLDPGATVKLKASATLDSTSLYVFRLRASNSSIVGGTIDFNRANQDRAAYNTALGSTVRSYWGVVALGTSVTRIENIKIHTRVINCADYGVALSYVDNFDVDVEVEDSGAGILFKYFTGGICRRAMLKALDNSDWEIFPHGFDAYNGTGATFNNIEIIDQAGYDIASGNSQSDWMTGITIADCDDLTGSNWLVSFKNDASMTKSVGMSMLGLRSSRFSNITVRRATTVHWEIGALYNCDFTDVFGDGEYLTSSLWASEYSYGIHVLNQGFYENISSRAKIPTTNCTFTNIQMTRMLRDGLYAYLMADTTWTNCRFNGNRYGAQLFSDNQNSSFLAPEDQVSRNNTFIGGEMSWNEIVGFWNGGSTDTLLIGVKMTNNGQAKTFTGDALRSTGTYSGTTAGYMGNNATTTVARTRPVLIDCSAYDDQSVTSALASVDPGAPTILSVTKPELYHVGQTINIDNGATGPVDLLAQIRSIENDEITISTAMTNFPLVAGTGTISTVGTAITFSSDQSAIINGRTWVKHSTNYRKVVRVRYDAPGDPDNGLTGTLESAFPSDLVAQAFDLVQFNAEQVRCQEYALYTASGANDAGLVATGLDVGPGNTTGITSLAGTGRVILLGKSVALSNSHTIASGAVTIFSNNVALDTEGAAASDDLDTINGGVEGDRLVIRSTADARNVVIKNGTGNIRCGSDRTLDTTEDRIELQSDGTNWFMLNFASN